MQRSNSQVQANFFSFSIQFNLNKLIISYKKTKYNLQIYKLCPLVWRRRAHDHTRHSIQLLQERQSPWVDPSELSLKEARCCISFMEI